MIDERPRQLELFRQTLTERLHAERFGCVVAAVKHVQSKVLGQRKGPVWALPGDECVHALIGCRYHFRTRAAGYDTDFAAPCAAAWQHRRLGAGGFCQALGQLRPREVQCAAQADRLTALNKKWLDRLDIKRLAQLGVIAESRMRIQRQVRAVNRPVVVE